MKSKISKYLNDDGFWLAGIATGLMLLYMSLTLQLEDSDRISVNILACGSISFLIWEKRHTLRLNSGILAKFLGSILICLSALKSISIFWFESGLIRVLLLCSALGIALLASGFKDVKQYWREFIIIFILAIPEGIISSQIERLINLNLLTAKIGTLFLWYIGLEVSRQGVNIILPTGAVEVYTACSGLDSIILLFRLSIIYLLIFPTSFSRTILVLLSAISLGYLVNGFRVALMALLVAFSNHKSFEYWHTGDGSQIFSLIAVLAFALSCSFLSQTNEKKSNYKIPTP